MRVQLVLEALDLGARLDEYAGFGKHVLNAAATLDSFIRVAGRFAGEKFEENRSCEHWRTLTLASNGEASARGTCSAE
jgi:hypothetical protein